MKSQNSKASLLGAAAAFVAFLVTGLVPALVYGGYMGLMLAGALFGHGKSDLLASRLLTGGGMVLGTVATLTAVSDHFETGVSRFKSPSLHARTSPQHLRASRHQPPQQRPDRAS